MKCVTCSKEPLDTMTTCPRCKKTLYCSRECFGKHWKLGHKDVCSESLWTTDALIEGRYSLRVAGEPPPSERAKKVVEDQPPAKQGERLLKLIVDRLENTTSTAGWAFAQEFFVSMRLILEATKARAIGMLSKTQGDLREVSENWEAMSGQKGKLEEGNANLSALQKWERSRLRDDTNENATDRFIIYLKDRENALSKVVEAINVLLGPREVIEPERGASPASSRRMRRYLESVPSPNDAIGIEKWNAAEPGIYLYYDWDDTRKEARNVIPSVEETDDDDLDTDMMQAVRKARRKWMSAFRKDLLGMSKMIGLSDIKGQVALFVQTLIVNPVISMTDPPFMNIAIMGEAGTGKTEIAKRLPSIFYRLGYSPLPYVNNVVSITGKSDWIAPYEGQSSHQARMKMNSGLGRVIVLDEAYSLVMDDADGFGKESLTQIVNDLDVFRGLVVFVILGYQEGIARLFQANQGMNRRFPEQWIIEPYFPEDLVEIFYYRADQMKFSVSDAFRREHTDTLVDIMKIFGERGILTDLNAALIKEVMGIYRGLFATNIFQYAMPGDPIRRLESELDFDMLITALGEFARRKGMSLWDEGVDAPPQVDRPPAKSVSFVEPGGDVPEKPRPEKLKSPPPPPVPKDPVVPPKVGPPSPPTKRSMRGKKVSPPPPSSAEGSEGPRLRPRQRK